MMPGTSPLTIVSFINVARRCAALLNSRPVAILPPSLSDPDEILSVSPNSLAGPSSATWWNLGAARNYSGQQALLQAHLAKFSKNLKIHYTNKLYSNSNMATESALEIDDIVLITDLSSNSGRSNPLPALGRIEKFLDPESRSQAVVKYHSGKVDRPISRLVRVVKADEEISKKGKTICPYALADEEIQAGWDEDSEDIHAQDEYGMDTNHQDDDQHEDLQGASQPHVPEEDNEQDVRGRPEGVQTPPLPIPPSRSLHHGQGQNQEQPQEEDRDKEKQETQDDILTVEEGPQPRPPQDSSLPQGNLPNTGNQDRPKRIRRPLKKFQ